MVFVFVKATLIKTKKKCKKKKIREEEEKKFIKEQQKKLSRFARFLRYKDKLVQHIHLRTLRMHAISFAVTRVCSANRAGD